MNLNDRFTVELTSIGAATYNEHYRSERYAACPKIYLPELQKAGDVLTDSLWSFMQIFGESIHLGMVEAPFKGCEMTEI